MRNRQGGRRKRKRNRRDLKEMEKMRCLDRIEELLKGKCAGAGVERVDRREKKEYGEWMKVEK